MPRPIKTSKTSMAYHIIPKTPSATEVSTKLGITVSAKNVKAKTMTTTPNIRFVLLF